MARDINTRLSQLQNRRRGTDRLGRLALDAQIEVLAKSYIEEDWQKRARVQPFTRYALGAMQEVGPEYTRISIETAQRVGRQLDQALTAMGFSIDFRLQGSVPLNVHIRGVSDVDLLNLDTSFFTYALAGRTSQLGLYTTTTNKSSAGVLSSLRQNSEQVLRDKFPAATVDCTGGKAIKISGGSLARPVDVVPSHWYDNVDYQNSRQEHDRGVTIFDRKTSATIDNYPFIHIKLIHERDLGTFDGLKKAIRLCKNVKSDADTEIALPNFDIAAIMYHADLDALRNGRVYELSILAETQRHLDFLYGNKEYAKTLRVPDGSRAIFDTEGKFNALTILSIEMDTLAREVAKEQNSYLAQLEQPDLAASRAVLSFSQVPGL
jgi:hypothetical protein